MMNQKSMNDDYVSSYSDARRYDLVLGAYATGDFLNFYKRQIARYGQPVLELACGSGRMTIPLANEGVNITGLDISEKMLDLAKLKVSKRGVRIRFIQGDIRSFDLGQKFKFIFIPAQSVSHLHTREEIENCFSCVRQHLMSEGRFLIELFNSSVKLLAREPGHRYAVGKYEDPKDGLKSVRMAHRSAWLSTRTANALNSCFWIR
jgi:2-polyprenyl-3-methyl-5-hydroxy-6-metoxy-1,4-benzoquinol methylase